MKSRVDVFHVTLMDMFRAHRSGEPTKPRTNPIAQSIQRTLNLDPAHVEVYIQHTLIKDVGGERWYLTQGNELWKKWNRDWDEGCWKIRRPFHFELTYNEFGEGSVSRI